MARKVAASKRRCSRWPQTSPAAPIRPWVERPARGDPGVASVEPARAGAVARDHAQELGQALAVAMLDPRLRPVLERPAALSQAPAEIDVTTRADAFGKAVDLVESVAAHEQVAGRRRHPGAAVKALDLVEEVAIARIASEQRVLLGDPDDAAAQSTAALGDRVGEVAIEQVGARNAIGVHEQQPSIAAGIDATISRVVGGGLAGRADDGRDLAQRPASDPLRGVVGDDQLVAIGEHEPLERRASPRRVVVVTAKRDHHRDGGPAIRVWVRPANRSA